MNVFDFILTANLYDFPTFNTYIDGSLQTGHTLDLQRSASSCYRNTFVHTHFSLLSVKIHTMFSHLKSDDSVAQPFWFAQLSVVNMHQGAK
jgi:hypothetical protein